MKIVNSTKNTIYVEDVDIYLPYEDGKAVEVDPDILKKSKSLRSFIINKTIDVEEYDSSERIEASVMYLRENFSKMDETAEPDNTNDDVTYEDLDTITDEIEVRIHGIFFDAGGYGKVNRNLALKLDEAGIKVKVDPKKSQNQLKESELTDIKRLCQTKVSKNHISIDSIIPSFADNSHGKYRILYTTIESYTIPKQFLECCQFYDEIWITSPWSAEILKKHVNRPIHLVPAGVDHELYVENGPKFDFRPNIKNFIFLSVFGWSYRKGYDVLLKAYFDEFDASDDVSLLISSRYQTGTTRFHRNKIRDDINDLMRHFPNKSLPHVVRFNQIINEREMPQLYRSGDCFVLPSRGEGSGLPPVEASLCGLPVIMTNVSGQQMYLRPDNSYLIEMDDLVEMKSGQMHLHYWDGQKFPALTSKKVHNDLRQTMRHVFENREEAKLRNKKLQKLILENFTWNNTANAAIKRLREIRAKW